jgi:hypothetical protein
VRLSLVLALVTALFSYACSSGLAVNGTAVSPECSSAWEAMAQEYARDSGLSAVDIGTKLWPYWKPTLASCNESEWRAEYAVRARVFGYTGDIDKALHNLCVAEEHQDTTLCRQRGPAGTYWLGTPTPSR